MFCSNQEYGPYYQEQGRGPPIAFRKNTKMIHDLVVVGFRVYIKGNQEDKDQMNSTGQDDKCSANDRHPVFGQIPLEVFSALGPRMLEMEVMAKATTPL